jgi:hypothetical protein
MGMRAQSFARCCALKHNKIIGELENRLIHNNYLTQKNVEYYYGEHQGEIDLYALDTKHNNILLFEIKSRDSIKNRIKAHIQLERGSLYLSYIFPTYNKVKKYYVYTNKQMKNGYMISSYTPANLASTPLKLL